MYSYVFFCVFTCFSFVFVLLNNESLVRDRWIALWRTLKHIYLNCRRRMAGFINKPSVSVDVKQHSTNNRFLLLLLPYSVQLAGLFLCFRSPPNSDMDYWILAFVWDLYECVGTCALNYNTIIVYFRWTFVEPAQNLTLEKHQGKCKA